jgi:hypothetical protein
MMEGTPVLDQGWPLFDISHDLKDGNFLTFKDESI